MKTYHYVLAVFALVLGLAWYKNQQPQVLGETVGSETYEVCWHGTEPADGFQLFYGQADQNKKDTTVGSLDSRSKCVALRYLKPCTTYNWNLNRLKGNKWSWQWGADQQFTTAGICPSAKSAKGSQLTTATGKKALVVGQGKGTVNWTPVNGATKYFIYYKAAGDVDWTHAVEIPPNSSSYTINYLDASMSYLYRVAALVNGKLTWMPEGNLTVQ